MTNRVDRLDGDVRSLATVLANARFRRGGPFDDDVLARLSDDHYAEVVHDALASRGTSNPAAGGTSNQAHLLEAPVRAAATALANARAARRGSPAIAESLDWLPESIFAEIVEDARAVLAAGLAAANPALRPRGPLSGTEAAALGLERGAGSVLILVRDRNGVAEAAQWAVGAGDRVFGHATAQGLWSACAVALTRLQDPPSPEPSPATAEPEPRP